MTLVPPAGRRRQGHATTKTATCEHRQIDKRNGKIYCRACTRQIYL